MNSGGLDGAGGSAYELVSGVPSPPDSVFLNAPPLPGPRSATPTEAAFFRELPGLGLPSAAAVVGIVLVAIAVEPLVVVALAFPVAGDVTPGLVVGALAAGYLVQVAGLAAWVAWEPIPLLRATVRPGPLVALAGRYALFRGVWIGPSRAAIPVHWRRRLVLETDAVTALGVRPQGASAQDSAVLVELQSPPHGEAPPLRLRLADDLEHGGDQLLWFHPIRGGVVLVGLALAKYAVALGPLAAAVDPPFAAAFWTRPSGWAIATAAAVAVPVAAALAARHVQAARRLGAHYARRHGAHPRPLPARLASYLHSLWAPLRDAATDARGEPDPEDGGGPLAPSPRLDAEADVRPDAVPAEALVRSVEWSDAATCAPGLTSIRVTPSPEVRRAADQGGPSPTLTIGLVGDDGHDHSPPRPAGPHRLLPTEHAYPVRVSETALGALALEAVVTVSTGDRREVHRSPPLRILGRASFWVGPVWDVERCAEGDDVRIGGAAHGLVPGARVRVTVRALSDGSTQDGDRVRDEVVDRLETTLDGDLAFVVVWRARRATRLHDEAEYLSWPPPVYRARVEVLGLADTTGDLTVERAPSA